jgi:hypothetical protein
VRLSASVTEHIHVLTTDMQVLEQTVDELVKELEL